VVTFRPIYISHLAKLHLLCLFFFQAEDGIRDFHVTGVQTCALPILKIVTKTKMSPHPYRLWFLMILLSLTACGTGESASSQKQEEAEQADWQTGIALYSFNRFS